MMTFILQQVLDHFFREMRKQPIHFVDDSCIGNSGPTADADHWVTMERYVDIAWKNNIRLRLTKTQLVVLRNMPIIYYGRLCSNGYCTIIGERSEAKHPHTRKKIDARTQAENEAELQYLCSVDINGDMLLLAQSDRQLTEAIAFSRKITARMPRPFEEPQTPATPQESMQNKPLPSNYHPTRNAMCTHRITFPVTSPVRTASRTDKMIKAQTKPDGSSEHMSDITKKVFHELPEDLVRQATIPQANRNRECRRVRITTIPDQRVNRPRLDMPIGGPSTGVGTPTLVQARPRTSYRTRQSQPNPARTKTLPTLRYRPFATCVQQVPQARRKQPPESSSSCSAAITARPSCRPVSHH
ncbi:hypothetical protein SARC_09893 [Sphaeroforma arctica JP610]|uniref:Uncharacterized protein n=1 Tax=Sphaeroforma arctica JP610 TaxID=667725 RepID=A0A0L0FNV1_9EUKA|nr:hypothetical protein SARC_09893 [Sphaeroforma arctica JP610]KNC77653.1 hypothetical protein SARC_09893 [Sphaeroforma arctica JP610]|eukprot:XP_014151555.1 hypothetical protein SARC_09893 [Sphaeroforma arctica JP610]